MPDFELHIMNHMYEFYFLFLPFIIWHPVVDHNRDSLIFIAIWYFIVGYPIISDLSANRNVSSFHMLEIFLLCAFLYCLWEILVKNGVNES